MAPSGSRKPWGGGCGLAAIAAWLWACSLLLPGADAKVHRPKIHKEIDDHLTPQFRMYDPGTKQHDAAGGPPKKVQYGKKSRKKGSVTLLQRSGIPSRYDLSHDFPHKKAEAAGTLQALGFLVPSPPVTGTPLEEEDPKEGGDATDAQQGAKPEFQSVYRSKAAGKRQRVVWGLNAEGTSGGEKRVVDERPSDEEDPGKLAETRRDVPDRSKKGKANKWVHDSRMVTTKWGGGSGGVKRATSAATFLRGGGGRVEGEQTAAIKAGRGGGGAALDHRPQDLVNHAESKGKHGGDKVEIFDM